MLSQDSITGMDIHIHVFNLEDVNVLFMKLRITRNISNIVVYILIERMCGMANLCYQIDQRKLPVRMIAIQFTFAKLRITLNSFCSRERNLKKRKGKNTEDMMILFPLQSVDHVLPLTLYGTFIAREISLKCRKKLRPCT